MIAWIIGIGALLYVIYAVALILLHPKLIYPFGPDVFEEAGYERYLAPLKDGRARIVKDTQNEGGPVVLFFMGNGGSLAYFTPILDMHRDAGRQVYALEYPGGGGLAGKASENGLKRLALRAYDDVVGRVDGPIIVHGVSMGTGLAQHVAANRPVAAMVLDSPFARMCELMSQASYVPACILPGVQKWDSLAYDIAPDVPILILHGDADRLIPLAQSQKLYAHLVASGADAQLTVLNGVGHNDLSAARVYRGFIDSFLSGTTNK